MFFNCNLLLLRRNNKYYVLVCRIRSGDALADAAKTLRCVSDSVAVCVFCLMALKPLFSFGHVFEFWFPSSFGLRLDV